MQNPSGIITLTTDFGIQGTYVPAMKGVILSIAPQANIIDISHLIQPQNIDQGAYVLEQTTGLFPPGTIHIAVVDPGVGTNREIILAQIEKQYYIAPNNGLLSGLVAKAKRASKTVRFYSVTNKLYWRDVVSQTFQGRDIMAPVAAHLLNKVRPDELGVPFEDIIQSLTRIPEPVVTSSRIEGVIEHIDSFGNLITNIPAKLLEGRPLHEKVRISVDNDYQTWGVYATYADQPAGTLTAIVNSSGRVEVAVVNGNGADILAVKIGAPIVMDWEAPDLPE